MPRTYKSRETLLNENKELKEKLQKTEKRLVELIEKNKSWSREAEAFSKPPMTFKLGTSARFAKNQHNNQNHD